MAIRALDIHKLFGHLDYSFIWDSHDIIMISGPNGYGKTMILRIINNIFSNNFRDFFNIKFSLIRLSIVGGVLIEVEKGLNEIKVTLSDINSGSVDVRFFSLENHDEDFIYIGNIKRKIRFLEQDSGKEEEIEGLSDDIFKFYFKEYSSCFIKAQRLHSYEDNVLKLRVKALANDLKIKISSASSESAILSQKLDSSFPYRLFNRIENKNDVASVSILDRLKGLEIKLKKYSKFDLVFSDEGYEGEYYKNNISYPKEYSSVAGLHVEDSLKKIEPYDDLYNKLLIFNEILNNGSLAFKEFRVNREKGFYFIDSINGDEIPLDSLSSGEQNKVIVFYDMIFNSKENSIILIDEPEISLHVAWQQSFFNSVMSIKKINNLSKVIVATHSPSIINDKWELNNDLFEMIRNNKGGN